MNSSEPEMNRRPEMRFPVEPVAFFGGSSENDFSSGFSVLNGNSFVSDFCKLSWFHLDYSWVSRLNCEWFLENWKWVFDDFLSGLFCLGQLWVGCVLVDWIIDDFNMDVIWFCYWNIVWICVKFFGKKIKMGMISVDCFVVLGRIRMGFCVMAV
jgi:hypothetical protein